MYTHLNNKSHFAVLTSPGLGKADPQMVDKSSARKANLRGCCNISSISRLNYNLKVVTKYSGLQLRVYIQQKVVWHIYM